MESTQNSAGTIMMPKGGTLSEGAKKVLEVAKQRILDTELPVAKPVSVEAIGGKEE